MMDNGYDNDGDSWFTGNDNIDNDRDSDDFSRLGYDSWNWTLFN